MKKLKIFLSILFGIFFLQETNSQTLDSIKVTSPINCYGDFASINVYMTQAAPAKPVKLMNYRFATPTLLFSYGSSAVTTGVIQPFSGMIAASYRMLMIDSVQFWTAFPPRGGSTNPNVPQPELLNANHPSIIGYLDYTVFGVPLLSNSINQSSTSLCYGDCDGALNVSILGGTPPYNISINGTSIANQNNSLGVFTIDTTYQNLCSGQYSVTVSDSRGCQTSPVTSTFNLTEPAQLTASGSVSSDYNGNDISCYGASDGEITAFASGGTSPYQYSLDGINYTSNPVFSTLSSGTYTLFYKDANNCTASETLIISSPQDLSSTVLINQGLACFAQSSASVSVSVVGGTQPFSYLWSDVNTQTTSTATNLSAGAYTVVVKDLNNCSISESITISEPDKIKFSASALSYNGFEISCYGASDGQIVISNTNGGTPGYDYSIDGGNSYSNSLVSNNLVAGNYNIVVRDQNACTSDTVIELKQPLQFNINTNINSNYNGVNVSCFGACDGSINLSQTNGVGVVIYNLNGLSQTSPNFSSLCGQLTNGAYTITGVDENGCKDTVTVSLIEPQQWIYSVDSTSETCNLLNGNATINVTQGGTGSLSYKWDDLNMQTTPSAINLSSKMYNVIVTDLNGCSISEDVFVNETDITISFDSVPPCNSLNGGSATVFPNGTPPYQITWDDGSTSNTITGLMSGQYYSVTVTDNDGCSVTDSVIIPNAVTVNLTLDANNSNLNVKCYGDQSNGIMLNATGGTGPNTYLYYIPSTFPTPQASNIFSGLYAGNYAIYVKDANNCTDSINVTINQPDQITFYSSVHNVSCFSGSDGSIKIDSIIGGTMPYSYSFSNGANTNSIDSLTAGDYLVSVSDINGCLSLPVADTITVAEPTQLQSSISINSHATCSGSQTLATGEMSVIVSGGSPGYNYTWSNGSNSSQNSFLMPGYYSLSITDDNGCVIKDSAEVLTGQNPQLDVSVQNVSCYGYNDGMIYASAALGTAPYQFSSDGGNTFFPAGTPFGPNSPSSYFITVVDALGCTDSDSVFISEPDLLQINNVIQNNVTCYDSSDAKLTVSHLGGTSPFTYLWNDPLSQNNITASNLAPGNYNVVVSDSNGCKDTSSIFSITQPDSLYLTTNISPVSCYGKSDGIIIVTAQGGSPNYSYSWNNGHADSALINVSSSNYSVTVSDMNGCTSLKTIFISQPQEIINLFVRDSVTCFGGNDGYAKALTTGGIPPYNYLWGNNDTTNYVNNLFAGINILEVTDSAGCVLIDSVNILEPSKSITIDSLVINPITCYGANNGTMSVISSGGKPPYLYSLDNGFSLQSNTGFINISSMQYIVYVEDQIGCFDRDTIFIKEPDSLFIDSITYNNVQCFNYCNGSIQAINVMGGTTPYKYSVNGGLPQTSMAYFNGYCPGTYTIEVIDDNNCVAQDFLSITEPNELNAQLTTSNWNNYEIRCNGENSGFAEFIVSGGIAPYTKTCIEVSSGDTLHSSTSNYIDSISAGLYRFIVQDSKGCEVIIDKVFYEPDPISHNFIPTHVSCAGWDNGALIDIVSGGVGTSTTYTYAWNTGDSTYSISNLSVGNYIITVMDENNCKSVDSSIIDNSLSLNASINNTLSSMVSCYDYCDGVISLNVTGGVPNIDANGNPVYSYNWNDVLSQNTQTAIGLCVDNISNTTIYTCVVSDSQGCYDTISYALNQPEELMVSASVQSDISCYGDNNGRLRANATGGNGGKQYLWNNSNNWNNSPINNNLISSSYVVVVRDNKGCMDTTEIFLPQPSDLIINTTQKNVSCYNENNGEITAVVSGGTPAPGIPPTYSYIWSPGNQTTKTAINLEPNIYSVTVTDDNNCSKTSSSILITQPSNPLTINVDSTDETCVLQNGTATAFVNGGTQPYYFSWLDLDGDMIIQGQNVNSINNLSPGLYNVDITDVNGCLISGSTFVNGVKNIFLPGNMDKIDTAICLGASVLVDVEEKPGFNYVWTHGPNVSDIELKPKSEGFHKYILSVTEPGCNPYNLDVNITVNQIKSQFQTDIDVLFNGSDDVISPNKAINILSVVTDESVELFSNNNMGVSHYWFWDQEFSTNSSININNIDQNKWIFLDLDSNGCKGYDSIYVSLSVIPFDAISPNGDMKNDTWNILGITANRYNQAVITIFNRWGDEIYKTYGGNRFEPWDGTKDGDQLPVGTYYYVINLAGQDEPITGPVTILR